jgi:hypothetical protein
MCVGEREGGVGWGGVEWGEVGWDGVGWRGVGGVGGVRGEVVEGRGVGWGWDIGRGRYWGGEGGKVFKRSPAGLPHKYSQKA